MYEMLGIKQKKSTFLKFMTKEKGKKEYKHKTHL